MSLVPKDEMNILRSAQESYETAQTAEDEIQRKAVAFLINHAANTGEERAVFQDQLRPATLEALLSEGYTLRPLLDARIGQVRTLISWKQGAAQTGDAVEQPAESPTEETPQPQQPEENPQGE